MARRDEVVQGLIRITETPDVFMYALGSNFAAFINGQVSVERREVVQQLPGKCWFQEVINDHMVERHCS